MSDDVKMFEGSQIRSVWDNEREEWYFSIIDVIASLTESSNPRDYWYRVKKRMSDEERSEGAVTECGFTAFQLQPL